MTEDLSFRIRVENDGDPAIKSAKKSMEDLGTAGATSAKQINAAMRQVPAQLTDIVVSLQAGQAPLTVLLQQGGQLKDMFGGVVPAAKALGGYIFGMVNPLTLAAAGAASLVVAFEAGRQESAEYNKQLALTGAYAGLSASQLAVMAASMSRNTGTQHEAAEVLAALVATGKIAGDQFGVIGEAALAMSKSTGTAIKDIVADFVALGDEPVKASAKLNETHHYLTAAIYEQIKALEEQGDKAGAAALAQTTYANSMSGAAAQVKEQIGVLQRAWRQLAADAKGAWDFMLNIGRPTTEQEELTKLEASLSAARIRQAGGGTRSTMSKEDVSAGEERAAVLRARIKGQAQIAQQLAEDAKAQEAGIAALDRVSAIQDKGKGKSAVQRELDKYEADIKALRLVNPNSEALTDKAVAEGRAVIQKQYGGTKPKTNENGIDTELVSMRGKTQEIQRDLKVSLGEIKASYDQGLISAKQFLDNQLDAKQKALAAELQIAQQQETVARGKKNLTAAERYSNDVKRIQDEMVGNMIEHNGAVLTLSAKIKRAVTDYQLVLTSAYNTRQQGMDDQLQSAGLGSRAAEELQRMTTLRREVDRRREELVRDRGRGQIGEDQYRAELDLLDQYWTARVSQEENFNAKSQALREDWTVGARQAINTYMESAQDIAGQTNRLWSNAFQGLEDVLVNFAMTGKLSFKSLADSFIAELIRMEIRTQASALMKSSGGGLGLVSSIAGLFGGGWEAAGVQASGAVTSGVAGGSAIGTSLGLLKNAKGGVYSSPSLSAFSNTVVDKPTMFAFAKGAGLMGEAGAEAIMPLTRGADGRLGVSANLGPAQRGGAATLPPINFISTTSKPLAMSEPEMKNGEIYAYIDEQVAGARSGAYNDVAAGFSDPASRVSRGVSRSFRVQRNRG